MHSEQGASWFHRPTVKLPHAAGTRGFARRFAALTCCGNAIESMCLTSTTSASMRYWHQ
jgi:hypothetical protein